MNKDFNNIPGIKKSEILYCSINAKLVVCSIFIFSCCVNLQFVCFNTVYNAYSKNMPRINYFLLITAGLCVISQVTVRVIYIL